MNDQCTPPTHTTLGLEMEPSLIHQLRYMVANIPYLQAYTLYIFFQSLSENASTLGQL